MSQIFTSITIGKNVFSFNLYLCHNFKINFSIRTYTDFLLDNLYYFKKEVINQIEKDVGSITEIKSKESTNIDSNSPKLVLIKCYIENSPGAYLRELSLRELVNGRFISIEAYKIDIVWEILFVKQ